jgi:hypothetical protein
MSSRQAFRARRTGGDELADFGRRRDHEGRGQLGMRLGRGSRVESKPADFVIVSDGESRQRLMGQPGLAPIRAPVAHNRPCQKGGEAGERWRTLGRHSLSDNQ